MNRSGIKRGMAALAISAVAVTGIPALAQADSVNTQVTSALGPTGVQLYNINTSFAGPIDATAKNDGTDTTVRLEAGGGINVANVTFQVARNGGVFADIATVPRNDDGAFFVEWNPAASGAFAGDTVEFRALNQAVPANFDDSGAQILRNASAINTQAINIAAGSDKGYYDYCGLGTDFYVGVVGTTSVNSIASGDRPGLAWMDGAGAEQDTTFNSSNGGDGTFEGTLDISSYTFDDPALPPADPDQLVVRAVTDTTSVVEDQTDDFEAYTLYEQTLTSVTAVLGTATAPDPAPVTLTALDQRTLPIAGIDLYDANNNYVGTSDGAGEVETDQADNINYYYADTNCNGAFNPGAGDKRSNDVNNLAASVTIVTSPSEGTQPVGTTVTETATVRDANGNVIANRPVRIQRTGPGSVSETVFRTTDANGVVTYSFTGTTAGDANITISIDGPTFPNTFEFASATDTVTFGTTPPPPPGRSPTVATLVENKKTGGRIDKLKVTTKSANVADGARVNLFRLNKDGTRVLVESSELNARGIKRFQVADLNRKKFTRYVARVRSTADTIGDKRTNVERTR